MKTIHALFLSLFCLLFTVASPLMGIPVITSLSTNSGAAGVSGDEIVINGTGFTGLTAVHFGSVLATVVAPSPTDTTIHVEVPKALVSTVPITVTAAGETSAISSASYFAYVGDWTAYFTSEGGPFFGINTGNNSVEFSHNLPGVDSQGTIAITPDGKTAYINALRQVDSFGVIGSIDLLTPSTFTTVSGTATEARIGGIAITPNGDYAYGVIGTSLFQIDTSNNSVKSTTTVPDAPFGIAIRPQGDAAYIANEGGRQVTPMNLGNNSLGEPLGTGAASYWVSMNPSGNEAYFTNSSLAGYLTSIKVATNTLNPNIDLDGILPHTMVVNPDGHHAYVVGFNTTTLASVLVTIVLSPTEAPVVLPNPIQLTPPFSNIKLGGIALTPSNKAYIASSEGFVIEVDINTRTVTDIPAFSSSFVAITPDPAPIALFSATVGAPATPTIFDAGDSVSPVGNIIKYDWDFGDGNTMLDGGETPSHTYATAGTYQVTLTVTNSGHTSLYPAFTGQTLTRNGGPSARSTIFITVGTAVPTVTSISPDQGPAAGGSEVVITGTNFSDNTLSVTIGGSATAVKAISTTQIVATTPAGVGIQQVIVTTGQGPSSQVVNYTYNGSSPPPPTVTGLNPSAGPLEGDQTVIITGTNFIAPVYLLFGDEFIENPQIDSTEMLTVTAPPYESGPFEVDILVLTEGGTSPISDASKYTYGAAPVTPPVVSELSPDEGPGVGGSLISISGENFFGNPVVYFGEEPATNVVVVGPSLITAISPAGIGDVPVTIVTDSGNSPAEPMVLFSYLTTPPPAPVIQSISPNSGVETGNTRVIIRGLNLEVESNTEVYFGGIPSDDVDINPDGSLTVFSPEGTGTVPVRVTTSGGTSVQNFTFTYTTPLPPTVTGVLPNQGPADIHPPRPMITVTGNHFYDIEAVFFGTKHAPYEINSPESLTVFVPDGGAGTVDITVETLHGTSPVTPTNGRYTYLNNPPLAPVIEHISPDHGSSEGNTPITITGERFMVGGGVQVYFGERPALSAHVLSNNTLEVTSPPGFGSQVVQVSTIGGTSREDVEFHYVIPGHPTVTLVEPNQGPTMGSQRVTITGTNFKNVLSLEFVSDGIFKPSIEFTVISDKIITAVSPANLVGTGHIIVITESGESLELPGNRYTYNANAPGIPVVSAISPASGSANGGTDVTITGSNFEAGGPMVTVYFGDAPAIGVEVISDTEIRAISPPVNTALASEDGEQSVVVTVSTTLGSSEEDVLFTYLFAAPTVTRVLPNEGPEEGNSEVIITGTGFFAVDAVYFGSAQVEIEDFTVDSQTQITVLTPPGVGRVEVSVATDFGRSPVSPGGKYTYLHETPPVPKVTSVTPNFGPAEGDTVVIIQGKHFVFGETAVLFGEEPAKNVRVLSEERIRATSPQGSGTVHVRVTTDGGTSGISSADEFTYTLPPPPAVTSISPNEGPQNGGSTVTITGTNFTAVISVAFGPYLATGVTVVSDTVITADSPPGEGTVQVIVKTERGSSAKSPQSRFTYLAGPVLVPTVTNIAPHSGPTSGGTRVTVTGSNFVSGNTDVFFGDIPGTNVVVLSATALRVTSPASDPGVVNVTVTTPGGTSAVSPGDRFTFIGTPPPPPPPPPPVVVHPPKDAHGAQLKNQFAAQADIINRITWKAPTKGASPVVYKIFKDAALKELLGVVSANSKRPYSFEQHNRKKNKTYTYYIVSIDGEGNQSKPAVVKIK